MVKANISGKKVVETKDRWRRRFHGLAYKRQ